MLNHHSFTIYNASAGSGKTYTLVKSYLLVLFRSKNPEAFKRILAITFTNKAVTEMKTRIIETLKLFSNTPTSIDNDMFTDICNELDIEPDLLKIKSKHILNSILHNYAAFDISTIDGFTHRIIRTFAHDLKLPLNFEVELDQDALITEAVDSLIAKAGTHKALTNVLVDFAIEKADNDKSWDLSFDFNKIAKLLVNENDIKHIAVLKDKTLTDFNNLKKQLKNEQKQTENTIVDIAQNTLDLIAETGLEYSDFSSGYVPKYFNNLANKNFGVSFGAKWQDTIQTDTLYPKRVSSLAAETIDRIQPQLATAFNLSKKAVFHLKFLTAFYKNITPLSVLNVINKELSILKANENKMLISEFNTLISKTIKNQPTPFIYERLGEKFNHYFIDEFQDTSVMQWQNLIPLIGNALSTKKGTAMLVGDAKQAIYRWRGGKAEQFIGLCHEDNPFHIDKFVDNLPKNFRSHKEIVTFNNGFFKFLSEGVFSNAIYKSLYHNAPQKINTKENGYVELSFLDINKDDDRTEHYCQAVLNTVNACKKNGVALNDICVLVRKKTEGIAIAKYLSNNNIDIISSETLLIASAPEVVFINNLMRLMVQPHNNEIKIAVLNYLSILFNIENKHAFFSKQLHVSLVQLFKSLEQYGIKITYETLLQLPLYDLAETLVREFKLVKTSNAYIQFYLDIILDFTNKKGSSITGFLEYFDKKKDNLSIISPQGQDAVQIMTIHKSKGLEFPVVIFPFADLDIYREKEPREWFPLNSKMYNGFSTTLLNFNKDFEFFGTIGLDIYNTHRSEQELDNINLLYVALTRAEKQLYIITKKDISSKGQINTKTYAGLFISYLKQLQLWNEQQATYCFGTPIDKTEPKTDISKTVFQSEFISTAKEDHNIRIITKSGMLWDTLQEEAIEKGNLIHNIMANIIAQNDIEPAILKCVENAIITPEQASPLTDLIKAIVKHPELDLFFDKSLTVYTERDIIANDGNIYRPDRIIINPKNNNASLLDYKTGAESPKHQEQVLQYKNILESMGYQVNHSVLVYINKTIKVKHF